MKQSFNGKKTDALMDKLLQTTLRPNLQSTFNSIIEKTYTGSPIAALIDLCSDCNLDCYWCIDKNSLTNKYLPTNKVIDLLTTFNELRIKSIVYCGGGEPLLHPNFGEILKTTHELGIDSAVYTNGILLNHFTHEILNYTKWCRVSIDSGNAGTYQALHKKDYFDHILSSITNIVTLKQKNHTGDFSIGISFVVMHENYNDIVEITDIAKQIGCDFVQFKPLVLNGSNERTAFSYSHDVIGKIKDQLSIARDKATEHFSVLITNPLQKIIDSKTTHEIKEYETCYVQNIIPLITPDGVYICPNWRGIPEKSYGNITTTPFNEIWHSPVRKKLCNEINPKKECGFPCIRHRTNALFMLLEKAEIMDINLFNYLTPIDSNLISDNYFI